MTLLLACTPWPADRAAPTPSLTAKKSAWVEGDEVPGWEDHDCGTPSDGAHQVMRLPEVLRFYWRIYGDDGVVDHRTGGFAIVDCEGRDCPAYPSLPHGITGWALADLQDTVGGVESRGQGGYGPTYWDDRLGAVHTGESPVYYWDTAEEAYHTDYAPGGVCVSRVRPDVIAGLLFLQPNMRQSLVYANVELRVPFEISIPERGGVEVEEAGQDPEKLGAPDWMTTVYYEYVQISYDDAWPWDQITDKAVRDAVYERYRPWNVE